MTSCLSMNGLQESLGAPWSPLAGSHGYTYTCTALYSSLYLTLHRPSPYFVHTLLLFLVACCLCSHTCGGSRARFFFSSVVYVTLFYFKFATLMIRSSSLGSFALFISAFFAGFRTRAPSALLCVVCNLHSYGAHRSHIRLTFIQSSAGRPLHHVPFCDCDWRPAQHTAVFQLQPHTNARCHSEQRRLPRQAQSLQRHGGCVLSWPPAAACRRCMRRTATRRDLPRTRHVHRCRRPLSCTHAASQRSSLCCRRSRWHTRRVRRWHVSSHPRQHLRCL